MGNEACPRCGTVGTSGLCLDLIGVASALHVDFTGSGDDMHRHERAQMKAILRGHLLNWTPSAKRRERYDNAVKALLEAALAERYDDEPEYLPDQPDIPASPVYDSRLAYYQENAKTTTADPINPAHYGGADNIYEAIKVIEAWGLDFCLGNTIKYISRAGKKSDKVVEDLKKGAWYLARRIKQLEDS